MPPEGLDELISRLAALGQERSRSLGTEEVGDELVDLQVRLGTQRASVERVRALLPFLPLAAGAAWLLLRGRRRRTVPAAGPASA